MAIVGGNGTGKSSILRAIDRFSGTPTSIEIDDFFGRRVEEPIEIGLTFTAFGEVEREIFAARIHNNEMTVVRVLKRVVEETTVDIMVQRCNMLRSRQYEPRREQLRSVQRITGFVIRGLYSSLRPVSRADQIPQTLLEWEANNRGQCTLGRDDGQFFGFTNVAKGALQRSTSFVFIPAVRDASADALDSRGPLYCACWNS